MKVKIRLLSILFLFMFSLVAARLFWWQVIKGDSLSEEAKRQYGASIVTSAARGNILASDGSPWVIRKSVWNIWANPRKITLSPLELARKISPLLVVDIDDDSVIKDEENRITELLKKDSAWVSLGKNVDDDVKNNIEGMDIDGIGFDMVESSFYPEASTAAQVLGFVGKDDDGNDIGYFGLEGYYNLPLSGKPGFLGGEKDAKGSPILLGGANQISAVAGVDLQTSLDKRVQTIVEKELIRGIEKYQAEGGSVTIMDPKTGNIIAMTSFPSYDPAEYPEYNNSLFKNPIITDTFEPGSILKVVVMAAGIDAKVVEPDTKCDICGSPLRLDKYFIKTWNERYTPDISMTDVIVESDNVGMSFVGQKLGADAMYDYLTKFGIGQKTGIDLQGEVAPKLREKGTWNAVDLATSSFGQGVAVTGIEMVRAVAAIANGGYLVTPKIVTDVRGDGWNEKVLDKEPIKIIEKDTASTITQMMVEAANRGEAKWCKVPGYNVAGKTGTAQIPVEGHYDEHNTIHSFIGFAPAKNSKFVMLVTLRSPKTSPWAAETAAPTWYQIADDLFPYFGIAPER